MSAVVIEPDPVQLEQLTLPQAEPCVMVIFGATGDLTRRKLMPALCRLLGQGCLEGVQILGIGRSAMSSDEFQTFVRDALKNSKKIEHLDEDHWRKFSERLHYMAGELDDDQTYRSIQERIKELVAEGASKNRLFYMATPPSLFPVIVKHLAYAGLAEEDEQWSRIVIEKPFGRDLESAKALNLEISKVLKESQVYRIDHYLGYAGLAEEDEQWSRIVIEKPFGRDLESAKGFFD